MINESNVRQFCNEDISKIENYEEAVNDKTQTWICHHILGEILTKEQLIEHDFYYNVPACMLKFVNKAEHNRLHFKNKKFSKEHNRKVSESLKGHVLSVETRQKISNTKKSNPRIGEKNSFYGKHHSVESRRKMSEAAKRRWASIKK